MIDQISQSIAIISENELGKRRDHLVWIAGNRVAVSEVCILPTQDTSSMGTAMVKQKEDSDTKIMAKKYVVYKM